MALTNRKVFHRHFVREQVNFLVNPSACFEELKKPPARRTEQGIQLLLKLIKGITFFQQLPVRAQRQLCQPALTRMESESDLCMDQSEAGI